MPNTPALVGEGATAIAWGRGVTAADKALVGKLFGAVGTTVEVPEGLMDAVTGLSGSGPAYVFTVIQALADGGVQAGLPRATALQLAAQTVLGAAQMVLATGAHPLAAARPGRLARRHDHPRHRRARGARRPRRVHGRGAARRAPRLSGVRGETRPSASSQSDGRRITRSLRKAT